MRTKTSYFVTKKVAILFHLNGVTTYQQHTEPFPNR